MVTLLILRCVMKVSTLQLRFSKTLWELRANCHGSTMKLVNFYSLASLENKAPVVQLSLDEFFIKA